MSKEKLVRRLKKILALAERGEGGEKDNAQRMLDALLEKHGISIEEIGSDEEKTCWFKYPRGEFNRRLLFQVIYAVCGDRTIWKNSHKRNERAVECTEYERAQIQIRFDAYSRALPAELELAYDAFIQVNSIFPEAPEEGARAEADEEYLERLFAMTKSMSKVAIFEALPEGSVCPATKYT